MADILAQDVWFAEFPFKEDNTKSKERPVIVLDVNNEKCAVLSMKIKSKPPYSEFEIELFDWKQIPLNHKSTADASSVEYVSKTAFRRRIGRLSDDDWDNITDLYARYLKSIGIFEP